MSAKYRLLMLLMSLGTSQAAVDSPPNTLTPEEAAQGWILLWDGSSPFGWEAEVSADWKSGEGVLTAPAGSYYWLRHRTPFANFVLRAECRLAVPEADSGIFIRAEEGGDPTRTGYQININNMNEEYGNGSLVFRVKSDMGKLAAKEWHRYEITADGDHITVVVNGRKVLDAHDGTRAMGYIGMQFVKGGEVEFRNLKLRPLGLQPLFNGSDLAGWEKVDRPGTQTPPDWSVKNGAIRVEKGPGQLETASAHGNFVLQLDVRTNAQNDSHHPNSGVFFRGDKGRFWSGYESQIRNEFKDGDRTVPVDFGTGGLYFFQPARRVVSSDGAYFTKTIVAAGRHMAIWVNGIQVTAFDDTREEGMDARNQARLAPGTVSLQAHDPTTNLDFRNIRIADLPGK